jgi:predicted metal-dependent peptidase
MAKISKKDREKAKQIKVKIIDEKERVELETLADKQMRRVRIRLVLGRRPDDVFFASLGLRLRPIISWDLPTAGTNGNVLLYNPYWWTSLSDEERTGVFLHEVLHCVFQHISRRHLREPLRWNVAGDLTINTVLRESAYHLPQCAIFPEIYKLPVGLSADEYYSRLPEELGVEGAEGDDFGGCGGVLDANADGDAAANAATEREWAVASAQAAQAAKSRGNLPASLASWVDGLFEQKVDWRHVLREFVTQKVKTDYNWSRPNKAYLHKRLYLPSLYNEALGKLVIHFDTSGSISDEEIAEYVAELEGIMDMTPAHLTLIGSDCQVVPAMVTEWEPGDGAIRKYQAHGRGGTSHVPVFDYVLNELNDEITAFISFTDLATAFPDYIPPYPVLWVAKKANAAPVPFGEVVAF